MTPVHVEAGKNISSAAAGMFEKMHQNRIASAGSKMKGSLRRAFFEQE